MDKLAKMGPHMGNMFIINIVSGIVKENVGIRDKMFFKDGSRIV
jgi:hypothetical protein